jgi:D-beta-D-heptose 7-phosphate kinase/D-beta-D-heptose 1-phosphate adenosyltransferase
MNEYHFIEQFSACRILCAGDVMLDKFIRGSISRISPEAPVPVLHTNDEISVLGGAGNVVRNLEALESSVTFISVVGNDDEGKIIQHLINTSSKVKSHILVDEKRVTTTKTRFIAANQQILRTDREEIRPLSDHLAEKFVTLIKENLKDHDLIILSDYAKGIFSPEILRKIINEANFARIPILIDPKGNDFSRYKGATLLTPNRGELAIATQSETKTDEEVVNAALQIIKTCHLDSMIVTRGQEGMTLIKSSGQVEHLPTKALEVFDVSGAGDTVIATLAASLAAKADLSVAMHLANTAAGLVVAKIGTAVVHKDELLSSLQLQDLKSHEDKIVSLTKAQEKISKWKALGRRCVFTNGCFDLLHPGHISLLAKAKKRGDRLILGLNTDASVQRLKGPTRPLQHEMARAFVLSSLESIDMIVLFDEDTPLELIKALRPDVLVKGADYTIDNVVGATFVQSYGGEVALIDLVEGQSTTNLVKKMG